METLAHKAKLVKVVDGDTLHAIVELDFDASMQIDCRLEEVNTPERGQPDHDLATQMLRDLIVKITDKDGYFLLTSKGKDKYGRWLIHMNGVNDVLKERWPYKVK